MDEEKDMDSPPPLDESLFGDGAADGRNAERFDMVMDIPVEISVEVGSRKMLLAEVVRLGPGAIVELGKASGEPLDVLANGHLIARGEAVVVGERYGVRIMDIVSPRDRLTSITAGDREES